MKSLKETGLAENTIVVLLGDHGWHLGDHGPWCKHSNFEQATAAPLIISAPGMTKGQKTKSHSEFIDIFPTVCELAGLPLPKKLEGDSLVPILKDKNAKVKDYSMSQYPRHQALGYSMRLGRYRLVYWMKTGFYSFKDFTESELKDVELFDYEKDPDETQNQASNPEYAAVLKK